MYTAETSGNVWVRPISCMGRIQTFAIDDYVFIHKYITYIYFFLHQTFTALQSFLNFSVIFSACVSLGALLDSKSSVVWLEPLRLMYLVVTCHLYPMLSSLVITNSISVICLGSLLFWPVIRNYFHHTYPTSASNGVEKKTKWTNCSSSPLHVPTKVQL